MGIHNLRPDEQRAALAYELIRLSISLYPKADLLEGPIDVLQLRRARGVKWIHRKENCPDD